MPLWSKKMLVMISIFLNLKRFCLCPKIWSIFENAPCALEKNVYSVALGWIVLKMSINSIWCNESFRIDVSLLIFCLEDLSNGDSGVLKSPTRSVLLSIPPWYLPEVILCISVLLYWMHLCLPELFLRVRLFLLVL